MANDMSTSSTPLHPVHRSINRPLTIWGAERRLFFVALVMGATTFTFFGSLLGGLAMFGVLYLFARWATDADPEILRIVLNSAKFPAFFDPLKRDPRGQGRAA
jgi:type IV secretory pathway TrbD component